MYAGLYQPLVVTATMPSMNLSNVHGWISSGLYVIAKYPSNADSVAMSPRIAALR
jgi:hypothetical protein